MLQGPAGENVLYVCMCVYAYLNLWCVLCIFGEGTVIDSPTPVQALAQSSLTSEGVLAAAHQVESLLNTSLIYNLCSTTSRKKDGAKVGQTSEGCTSSPSV